jgi:23S rRNA U2552 (ribose-2'-O)-methylase RlmE/FtsJ|tara:strand:- start:28 stop:1251 length:1224 start_codon:yes stop_codon:yes gene_type:complete
MTYFQVPNINLFIRPEHIKLKFRKQEDYTNYISLTLAHYLTKVKKRINKYPEEWDNIKRITNSYEYIHTTIPHSKHSISKINPLSRAFFKLIEIYNTFDLFSEENEDIKSFHLAEGPGGFIEAITYLRFNTADKYYGMTLLDQENDNIPGWKKSLLFLKKNKNVFIEKGPDGTGNLYSPDNFKHCYDTYKNSMDFMTADGGFDFSVDFNKQEAMALRLIFTEVIYAIIMQKKNGNFVLKMFDTFLKSSIDIIFMLSSLYSEVYITKPDTSRTANSERYIVCKGFKLNDSSYLFNKLHHILIMLNNSQIDVLTIQSLIDIPLPYKFKISIAEINSILGNQQIDNILTTLRFIENKERKGEKINTLRSANIQKCVTWCIKNKIPYHKTASTGNIFMTNRKMKSSINKTL